MSSLEGKRLGRFQVRKEIGAGGMGIVYLAYDERLGKEVAIKVLQPELRSDASSRTRQDREARALADLSHKNVAAYLGLYSEDGHDFLAMEYVPGETLAERVARGALPEAELLRLGEQLAEGLAAAHGVGLVHRDLKPLNLKITPDGVLKILDFGLAKPAREDSASSPTIEDAVPGTLAYLAPELLVNAPASERSDLYAAGLVLYEAATGSLPFPGLRGAALFHAITNTPVEPPLARNPHLSQRLNDLILRCLAKRPELRPASAVDLAEGLRALRTQTPPARRPVAIWVAVAVVLGSLIAALVPRAIDALMGGMAPPRTWAVLPLGTTRPDSEHAYVAEGMAEELVGGLSSMPSIRVISYESSSRYDPAVTPMKHIARALGAQGLVTGKLWWNRDQVRVSVHLSDGRFDRALWSKSFEGDSAGVSALQASMQREVEFEVHKHSRARGAPRSQPRNAAESAAYDAYRDARHHWSLRPGGLAQAIEGFNRAIQADSMYAPAWAGLADAHAAEGLYGLKSVLDTRPRALHAAWQAVRLDAGLSSAHGSLGQVLHNFVWDWEGAEAQYRQAIALNPSDADAHHGLAHLLVQLGRHTEAMREIRAAIALNPRSLPTAIAEGSFQYFARNYDSSLVVLRRVAPLGTENVLLHRLSAAVLDRLGRRDEAVQMLVRAVELQHQVPLAGAMRQAYAARGIDGPLEVLAAALIAKRAAGAYEPAEHVAELYARLGRVDDAFHWLEVAFLEHDTELNRLNVDPLFDPLRKDPRFADLMRRVGFPEADS